MKNKTGIKSIWTITLTSVALLIFGLHQCSAQDNIGISLHQDGKLLIIGDNIGNNAGTLDLVFRLKLQGYQDKWGYAIVFPEYEYSNLAGGKYVRYSINTGYVFNKLILDNLEVNITGGFGWIDRFGTTYSASFGSELAYKINKKIKASLMNQYTNRSDIGVWRYSVLWGLEFTL
jgi:hypothetical protein